MPRADPDCKFCRAAGLMPPPSQHQGSVDEADGLLEFDRSIKSIEAERIGERFNSEQFLQIAMVWRAVHEYLSLPGAPSLDYRPPWSKLLSYWKRSKSIPLVSGMHATMRLELGEVSKGFPSITYIQLGVRPVRGSDRLVCVPYIPILGRCYGCSRGERRQGPLSTLT